MTKLWNILTLKMQKTRVTVLDVSTNSAQVHIMLMSSTATYFRIKFPLCVSPRAASPCSPQRLPRHLVNNISLSSTSGCSFTRHKGSAVCSAYCLFQGWNLFRVCVQRKRLCSNKYHLELLSFLEDWFFSCVFFSNESAIILHSKGGPKLHGVHICRHSK